MVLSQPHFSGSGSESSITFSIVRPRSREIPISKPSVGPSAERRVVLAAAHPELVAVEGQTTDVDRARNSLESKALVGDR